MKIIAYLNPMSRHSRYVRAIMKKYNLEYEEHDIAQKKADSDQDLQPYIDINGKRLASIDGRNVEKYLLEKGLVEPTLNGNQKSVELVDEEQEVIRSKTIRFF
jgi:monothiol glutaredoxin